MMRCTSFCVHGRVLVALLIWGAAINSASAQAVSFRDPVNLPVGTSPEAIATGYFKGDNILDLAVANAGSNTVSILLGNPDGSFQNPVDYPVGTAPWFITATDLNGDGIPDLVVSNQDSGDVTFLLGVGDGTFIDLQTYSFDATPFSTVAADFDSDGTQDLVVSNTFSAFLLLGRGNGTFGKSTELVGPHARFVATGDFNGDNIPDLAITNGHGVDNISILLGQGDGTFNNSGNFAVG
jgi:hypothetical protein